MFLRVGDLVSSSLERAKRHVQAILHVVAEVLAQPIRSNVNAKVDGQVVPAIVFDMN